MRKKSRARFPIKLDIYNFAQLGMEKSGEMAYNDKITQWVTTGGLYGGRKAGFWLPEQCVLFCPYYALFSR